MVIGSRNTNKNKNNKVMHFVLIKIFILQHNRYCCWWIICFCMFYNKNEWIYLPIYLIQFSQSLDTNEWTSWVFDGGYKCFCHVIHVTWLVLGRSMKQKFGHMTRFPTLSVRILVRTSIIDLKLSFMHRNAISYHKNSNLVIFNGCFGETPGRWPAGPQN